MVTRSAVVEESEIIKCPNCGYEFGIDEADVCRKCRSHICPKCGVCSCHFSEKDWLVKR